MKKLLMLFFLWLGCNSIFAQVNKSNYASDSQSITTNGITLPQLITTDINRSELQFGVNLSQGLEQPDISARFKKFVSDKNKQFTITSGVYVHHSLSFNQNDNRDFYRLNGLTASLGADLKLFSAQNYFIQIGTQNSLSKYGGFSEFDYFQTRNSLTLGFGKGRIDFVSDGAAAISIVEKLSEYSVLKRDLSQEEYGLLAQKVTDLKNRRKFANRSYPLTESEEIQDLLLTFGLLSEDVDVTAIINDAYKFEPMLDRTTGSQFSFSATGIYSSSNLLYGFSHTGLNASLSYIIHSPINSRWQYNKGIAGFITLDNREIDDPFYIDNKLKKAGIGVKNDLHYLVDTRTRLSFLSDIGYNFVNKVPSFYLDENPLHDAKGFYLNMRTEIEYQISRTMSTTFGLNLRFAPKNTYTGLSLGLNF